MGFSRPEGDDDEGNTSLDLPPALYPLLKRMEEQENRISGIYELLQEQSKLLKSINQQKEKEERGKGNVVFLR